MKKKIIFFVLFIGFMGVSLFGQIQSGKVLYKLKVNQKNVDTLISRLENSNGKYADKLTRSLTKTFEREKRLAPYITYTLTFNDTESLFQSPEEMPVDNGLKLEPLKYSSGSRGKFYTNIATNTGLHHMEYYNKTWLVSSHLDRFRWTLTKETKIIKGYRCRKAITHYHPDTGKGGKIIAWFTTELPFQYGPVGYAKLPGLILLVKQGFYTLYAHKIKLYKRTKPIETLTAGERISHQAFKKALKEYNNKLKGIYAGKYHSSSGG